MAERRWAFSFGKRVSLALWLPVLFLLALGQVMVHRLQAQTNPKRERGETRPPRSRFGFVWYWPAVPSAAAAG